MSIFKRGKHAKDEVPAEFVQQIAEAVEPYLVVQDEHAGVLRPGEYVLPKLADEMVLKDEQGNAYRHPFEEGAAVISPFELELDRVLGEIKELLLEKNASYGDSALNPVRIMSDADAAEQIRIRMDDKLSRLYRGFAFEDTETGNPEDTLKDLVGYYFLLKIAEARHA